MLDLARRTQFANLWFRAWTLESERTGLEVQLPSLTTVWPSSSYTVSLHLSFLICEMGIIRQSIGKALNNLSLTDLS